MGRPYGADLINCACAPRHRERNETLLSRRRIASLLYMPLLLLFPSFAAVEINRIIWSSSPASVSAKNATSFSPLSQAFSTTASARDVSPWFFFFFTDVAFINYRWINREAQFVGEERRGTVIFPINFNIMCKGIENILYIPILGENIKTKNYYENEGLSVTYKIILFIIFFIIE